MRHIMRLGEGDGDKNPALFYGGQLFGQCPGRLILVEMIACLFEAFDLVRGRDATRGNYQMIVADTSPAFALQMLVLKIKMHQDRKSTRLNSSHVANSYAV